MKKWMPLNGDFIENKNLIIFQGSGQQKDDNFAGYNSLVPQVVPSGMILFEDIFSCGSIEVSVKFEGFDKDDLAQIVFNYQNQYSYMCAGVGNTGVKYGVNIINGQTSNTISAAGFMENLPIFKFDLKVQLIGSYLELWVNSIRVLTSPIPFFINPSQAGILVRSNREGDY